MRRREFLATAAGTAAWLAARRGAALAGTLPNALAPRPRRVYVGTYTDAGRAEGVFRFRVDARTGAWHAEGGTDVGPNPSYLALHPDGHTLYAVNELETYEGAPSGAVSACAVDPATGALTLRDRHPSRGGAPCYVSVERSGRSVLAANYVGGSVARFPVLPNGGLRDAAGFDQHTGTGPRADRQERPHAHSILPNPSGRFALSADLGADRLYVYALGAPDGPNGGLSLVGRPVEVAPGSGPRHLAFHPTRPFLYVAHELSLSLGVHRFDAATGALAAVQTVPLVDAGGGERTAADLHVAPSGRFVYASVRGDDLIVVCAVDERTGRLTVVQRVSTGGKWPRNFALDPEGRMLYVANQRSNDIVGFRVDAATGRLTPSGMRIEVPAPVCIRFA